MFDREIDLEELREWLRYDLDWWFYGMVALAGINLVFGAYLVWSFLATPDFFTKYKLAPSSSLVKKAQNLQEVPMLDEIEVERDQEQGAVPSRYADLHENNIFVPLGQRSQPVRAPVTPSDTEPQPEQTLPRIEGFEIVGRITGQGTNRVSMVKRTDDGKTFVAREGKFLEETDVKVVTVTDTMVRLNRPEHRPTSFQFRTDEIKERIRDAIRIQ